MRKYLFILTVMIIVGNCTWGQDFAPIGAVWHYVDRYDESTTFRSLHRYESVSDTIIQGISCRKIESLKISSHINATPVFWDTIRLNDEFYYGTNDTVFRFNRIFNRFLPQFIFNVNIGDTVFFHIADTFASVCGSYNPSDSLFRIKITNKINTIIGGVSLKEIYFQPLDYNWWGLYSYREKIGFFSSFYNDFCGIPVTPLDYEPFLRCYIDNQIQYRFNNAPCDSLPTTDAASINLNKLSLSPNPTKNLITIDGIHQPTVAVYNLMGQKVLSPQMGNEISLASLPDGLYIVHVFNKDMQLVSKQKVVKE